MVILHLLLGGQSRQRCLGRCDSPFRRHYPMAESGRNRADSDRLALSRQRTSEAAPLSTVEIALVRNLALVILDRLLLPPSGTRRRVFRDLLSAVWRTAAFGFSASWAGLNDYFYSSRPETCFNHSQMFNAWWLLWLAFFFLFLVSPVTYGWGYRGWGPPYPRYVQRRRGLRASGLGQPVDLRHQSWGWGGDFVWVVLLVAARWDFAGLLLR